MEDYKQWIHQNLLPFISISKLQDYINVTNKHIRIFRMFKEAAVPPIYPSIFFQPPLDPKMYRDA